MAVLVTELVTRVREYADARDDGDDPYISDSAILAWLNQENRKLIRLLTRYRYAHGPLSVSFTTTTTVLSGVVAILSVTEVQGTSQVAVPRLLDGAEASVSDGRFWTVTRGATGSITVTVGKSGSYFLTYVPAPATLVLATPGAGQADSVYYPPGWEEVLVIGAALRAKAKEGSDTESPLLRQLYQDEWNEIEVEAAHSDQSPTVLNTDILYPLGWSGTNGYRTTLDWWTP